MISIARRNTPRAAWRLAKGYWTSEEKWFAWTLLIAVLGLNLSNVYISVRINDWNRTFYNALQSFNAAELFRQLAVFGLLVALSIGMSVYALYLNQFLQIRWRRWLTRKYIGAWLGGRAYYRLQLGNTTDNPDQRISEDLHQFTSYFLNLSVGTVTSIVSLFSFLAILWNLSGAAEIPLGHWPSIHVPGYLVWAALLYAGLGTWLTIKIGRPLVPLNFARQRLEADFRYSLVRLRENTESVALHSGEPVESGVFHERFQGVFENFRQIMKRQRLLSCFTLGYTQVAVIFPMVIVSPRYFARQIGLGGFMQAVNAFSFVQNSLSFIINSYSDIAAWQAVTQRLSGFEEQLMEIHHPKAAPRQIVIRPADVGVSMDGVDLDLPDGTPLLCGVTFTSARAETLLITGPTGSGKSTLLRALAGIWPYGSGEIKIGKGRILIMPQRPYLPLGTLVSALLYPFIDQSLCLRTRLPAILEEVGLDALASELDRVENWSQRLSLGEQQRLAFARILLTRPSIIFLDEATSALDESSEAHLFFLLRTAPWQPTVVSVGHRSALRQFHNQVVDITAFTPSSILAPCRKQSFFRNVFLDSQSSFVVPSLASRADGPISVPVL